MNENQCRNANILFSSYIHILHMQPESEAGFLLFCTSVPLVEVLQARLGPWGRKCIPTAHSVFVQLQRGLNY